MISFRPEDEWLEVDGQGGFAMGTVSGFRTRRYHALLLVATNPPTGRFVLVNGIEAWVTTPEGTYPISSQAYAPDVIYPDGASRIEQFELEPWPRWTFRLEDGTRISQEIFVPKGYSMAALSWKLLEPKPDVFLSVRPLLSGRDYHSLHHENPDFCFDPSIQDGDVIWQPYAGVPAVVVASNGDYSHSPEWYRNFSYRQERDRGLDFSEDLASPGIFRWDLTHAEAVCLMGIDRAEVGTPFSLEERFRDLREAEADRRRQFPSRLHRSADDYIARRGKGKTVMAGYPWFTDWGRDTFISLRGLCMVTNRIEEADQVLMEWAGTVSQGMIPNRFPDHGEKPEYNSVDASLWYVMAIGDFFQTMRSAGREMPSKTASALEAAVQKILTGYVKGTRFGIGLDSDGLLRAGEPGVALTWMDAKVTPRIGKPVEVQALWLNALMFARSFSNKWQEVFEKGERAFQERFWNASAGCLYDVVDADHVHGRCDSALRPNQIFAAGGLPYCLLDEDRARQVVSLVETRLWTPLGLRSLAPGEPGYIAHYVGGVLERDGAYHQGTVWPWLAGAFVDAWLRGRGHTPEALKEARERFLAPLLEHMNQAGLGHISEIADGDFPHTPRGCPFQAWSVAEVLRLAERILADPTVLPGVSPPMSR